MLAAMRKFVRSKLGFALFVLLIISFGIFFRDPFTGIMGGGFVEVGGRTIRPSEIDSGTSRVVDSIRQEEGRIIPPRDPEVRQIAMQVYQRELQQALVLEYASKIGVRASPSAVTGLLMSRAPRFKDALGRINLDEIRVAAREQNQTVEQFQNDIRDSLTFGYMLGAVEAGPVTPEIITKPLLTYFGEQRTVSAARVPPASIPQPKAPTDDELKTWYEQNKQRFAEPERRRISVLSYSVEDFYDKVPVTDEQIKAEYDRRIKDFSTPETREVAQFTGERAALQALVDTVKQGVAPEEAIKKAPAVTRVDLTLKPGGLKDEQFDNFVFGIQPGQIMGPVQSEEAWYVVLVTKVIPGDPTPLEQVSDGIRRGLQENDARRLFNSSEETFYDLAGGVSLEEIGSQIGAPTIILPPVDNSGRTAKGQLPRILTNREDAVRAIFGLPVGQMTDVIEGDASDPQSGQKQPTRAIMRLDEIVAAHTLTFEEAKSEAREIWLAQKIQETAEKMANDMAAAVKSGRTFEQAAAANKLTVLGSIPLVRGMSGQIDARIFDVVFGLKEGDASMVKDTNGQPWVVKVDKVQQIDDATAGGLKSQIQSQVAQSLLSDMQEVFLRGIQKEVPVKTNDAAVQAYFERLTKTEDQ